MVLELALERNGRMKRKGVQFVEAKGEITQSLGQATQARPVTRHTPNVREGMSPERRVGPVPRGLAVLTAGVRQLEPVKGF